MNKVRKLGAIVVFAVSSGVSAQSGSTIITTDGIQGISAGMTHRQVSHLIGRKRVANTEDSFECDIFRTRSGLADVMIQRGIVTSVATDSSSVRTLSGAHAGMPEGALRKLYGNRLRRLAGDYSGFDYYLYSNSGNGIRFHVENGKILSIVAGKRTSIELAEGCL